ncbi:MAG: agglutinin biogenesis protein MshI [Sulfuricellaceae bacterium]|nr:agglutinin biogenesis protein MshI [Sulfuricellaceae bacterium]
MDWSRLFPFKSRQKEGWFAFSPIENGVCFALIKRRQGAKPEVTVCETHTGVSLATSQLERLVKPIALKKQSCSTLLEPHEFQIYSLEAPRVPEAEMKLAIRWRVKDMIGFPLDDATVEILDIPIDKYAPGRTRTMYAVVARNEIIRQRANLCEESHIPLSAIDIPEMAQRNIAAFFEREGLALALLAFDQHGGLLTFTAGGELYLSRRFDMPARQFREIDGADGLQLLMNRIMLELQRSLDYFDRQFHFIPLDRLLLAPLPVNIELREYLAENLSITVDYCDLDEVLDFSLATPLASEERTKCFHALGAALRLEE